MTGPRLAVRRIASLVRLACVAAILAVVIVAPRSVMAAPHPPTPKPPTPSARPSPPAAPPQTPAPAPLPAPQPQPQEKPRDDQLIDSVLGKQQRLPGEQPLSHYDIGYSSGGWFGSFHPSAIMGWLTDIIFTLSRWMTAFALWAINYALTFGVASFLIDPASKVATGYQHAVDQMQLGWVFLVLAVAYAGWHALRGRATHGLGEAAVSFLIATVLAGVLAAPATVLLSKDGILGRTSDISLAVAGIALDPTHTDQNRGQPVSAPMQAKLQHTLIGVPHQLLNWGRVLEGPGAEPKCAAKYQDLLARGPWGDSDKPRDEMREAGCGKLADFNKKGTPNRLIVAVLIQIAVALACCLLALMAFTVVGAQILLALLACFAPLAVAAGILPGTGRQILIRWATAVPRALAGVVMSIAALSVTIVLPSGMLRSDSDMPLIVRIGLLDVFMVVAFVFRKRFLEAGRRTAANLGQRLEQMRFVGSRGRGLMPAGSALAAAEAWGAHYQRGLGLRARSEVRQIAHGRWSNRRFARTIDRAASSRSPGPPTDGGSTSLRTRLASSRAGRTVKFTAKATGLALAATVGAPVYLPRATRAAKIASKAKSAAVRKRLTEAKRTAKTATVEFGQEYVRGVTAPARLAARIATRSHRRSAGPEPKTSSRRLPDHPGQHQKADQPGTSQSAKPQRPVRSRPARANRSDTSTATPTPDAPVNRRKPGSRQPSQTSQESTTQDRPRRRRPRPSGQDVSAIKRTSRRTPPPLDGGRDQGS